MSHDIAIIGGGMSGVAAALAACDAGKRVILTEETDWLGGQMTSQGVSAFDEHKHIETYGGTQTYIQLRDAIRQHYIDTYGAPAVMPESVLGPNMPLNPGNGWVSRLCFEPRVGLKVIHEMLKGHLESGLLTILYETIPVSAEMDGHTIRSVTVRGKEGETMTITAQVFIDATELGELLPLTHTAYVTGAEGKADTGEAHAADEAHPNEVQGFTYCFAVEYCPGESHIIEKPEGYETFRDHQPYTLSPIGRDGKPVVYKMFEVSEQGNLPFWSYRRIYDGSLLGGNDIALINWISNDYHGANIIDVSAEEKARILDEAKRLSLGFLYWLQTECPRDEGSFGYPEFKLRHDVMGTEDGLSKYPYVRESRRIVPMRRVVEGHIAAESNPGARAHPMEDSVGIGWYSIDLHPCVGNPKASMYAPTKPFQIPLGALIPRDTTNLIAACKNIGTTHLTNGAYRLHPTEWAIGEAAGKLGALCIDRDGTPHHIYEQPEYRVQLQQVLTYRGVPLNWDAIAKD
jgi:hypothetical protein